MKKLLVSLLSVSAIATSANAGSPTPYVGPVVAPVAATQATDWSGLYVGGLVSFDSGTRDYDNNGDLFEYDYLDTTGYGGFAGYNVQKGSLVFGGEVAMSSGGSYIEVFPNSSLGAITDLKARVGYSFGSALIYGVVGYSMTEWELNGGADVFSVSGLSYGAGLDYLLGENLFVGVAYMSRDMSAAASSDPGWIGETNVNSAEVRVGWKF